MPQGKNALVKNLKSKSAISKKQDNAKLQAKKKKLKAKTGGVLGADHKSRILTQRGHTKEEVQITKCIQRRITEDVHSRAAKRGSAFGVVKAADHARIKK
eukprot:TRINITY_DN653_c0_g1_i1.p2 TRINITY_DN653_c0_g1~~TRINITY_DN653_c0_g1_i1.p2  ORF type:complete len:100 (-),score=36.90 TRINITY_DN653_c0_g1_i1:270-569(-)